MLSALYDIVVQPLVYLIELVFALGYRFTGRPGVAIVFVSLAVNLLCLPLYRMADAAQDAERERQAQMKPWADHINARFSGDERVMMTQAYYRLQHYRPAQALVGSLSLLLQIPFFMAAYSCLSGLSVLRGSSFLFLPNLGSPDALLSLGGFTINVMPVLMTALNCASTAVYTRGLPLRDKLQAYVLAAVFLVLLWDSPSGLVFYWTCNQLFSLGKNIFMKVVPKPGKWARALAGTVVLVAFAWLLLSGRLHTAKRLFAAAFAAALLEATLVLRQRGLSLRDLIPSKLLARNEDKSLSTWSFVAGAAFLATLLGVWIPTSLISDSPSEFVDIANGVNPLASLLHTACVWVGVFLWVGAFYALAGRKNRDGYVAALWCLGAVFLADYLLFGRNLGIISNTLVFDTKPHYDATTQLLNLALLMCVLVTALFVWERARRIVTPTLSVLLVAALVTSTANMLPVLAAVREDEAAIQSRSDALFDDGEPRRLLHLSRDEQNVVILFIDRAISGYLPYLLAERPELTTQLDGFVYYPNTVSLGINTMFSSPSLYGGYDYTPEAINTRTDATVAEKHNEAMLLLPTLFSQVGYQTTVIDPPYAGSYDTVADLSIYDGLDNTDAYIVESAYASYIKRRYGITAQEDISRSLFFYALFKAAPVSLQPRLYDKGRWLSTDTANPPRDSAIGEFATLDLLPELTDTNGNTGGFVFLHNMLPHEITLLQLPDYLPAPNVDNSGLEDSARFTLEDGSMVRMGDTGNQLKHYHVTASAVIQIGEYCDWLREQGVYDNTRIIVVSDHGFPLGQFDGWRIDDTMDVEMVNPLLMVKDFGATGFSTSNEFMTCADVATLATSGVLGDATNPFTGNPIQSQAKERPQLIPSSGATKPAEQTGTAFDTADMPWYFVHDDIFDLSNWRRYDSFADALAGVAQ